jgi:hypothetical protein
MRSKKVRNMSSRTLGVFGASGLFFPGAGRSIVTNGPQFAP